MYAIMGKEKETGELHRLFTWTRDPKDGVARAWAEAERNNRQYDTIWAVAVDL